MDTRYSFSFVALFFVAAGTLFAAWSMHDSVAALQTSLATKHALLTASESQASASKQELARRLSETAPTQAFVSTWAPLLEATRDASALLGDLPRIAQENTVSVQYRRTVEIEKYRFREKDFSVKASEGTAVSAEYYRLMNWLGGVERTWPLARFETMKLQQNGASLHLQVRATNPTFLLDPTSSP